MKKRRIIIMTMLLIGILGLSTYAYGLLSNHWAKPYAEQLLGEYPETKELVAFNRLDKEIHLKDLNRIIDLVIPHESPIILENTTREAVISGLMDRYSDITGISLGDMMVPMVIVFDDEEDIKYDYKHNVMLAYYHGLTKGKGNNLFAPKSTLTNGEALALMIRIREMIRNVGDTGSEIKANEEMEKTGLHLEATYTVQPDAVTLSFRLTNHSENTKELEFASGQQFEIVIMDEAGNEVYRYSYDKFFTMALIFKELNGGETLEWSDVWDRTDKEGNPVEEGTFKATISIVLMNLEEFNPEELTTVLEFKL